MIYVLQWTLISLNQSHIASIALSFAIVANPLLMWLMCFSSNEVSSEQAVLGLLLSQTLVSVFFSGILSVSVIWLTRPRLPRKYQLKGLDFSYHFNLIKRGLANAGEIVIHPVYWFVIDSITTHIEPGFYPVLTVLQRIETVLIYSSNPVIHACIPQLTRLHAQQQIYDFKNYLTRLIRYILFIMVIGSTCITLLLTSISYGVNFHSTTSDLLRSTWPWTLLLSNQIQVFVFINTIASVVGIYSVPWIGNLLRLLVLIILLLLEQTYGFLTLNQFWAIVAGWQGVIIAWEAYRCRETITK